MNRSKFESWATKRTISDAIAANGLNETAEKLRNRPFYAITEMTSRATLDFQCAIKNKFFMKSFNWNCSQCLDCESSSFAIAVSSTSLRVASVWHRMSKLNPLRRRAFFSFIPQSQGVTKTAAIVSSPTIVYDTIITNRISIWNCAFFDSHYSNHHYCRPSRCFPFDVFYVGKYIFYTSFIPLGTRYPTAGPPVHTSA